MLWLGFLGSVALAWARGLGGAMARPLWSPAAWKAFVEKYVNKDGATRKAALPLTATREMQETEVHEWLQNRNTVAPKTRKRTAFTLKRVGKLSGHSSRK